MKLPVAVLTAALLTAAPALAHPGDHSHMTLSHLLEPDHLALIVAGLLAAGLGVAGFFRRDPR